MLYAGAALAAGAMRLGRGKAGAPPRRTDLSRIVVVAIVGAAVAPVCLAWGLARAGATAGSLVLNLEAVLTVVLAWLIYREPLGRRVLLAVVIMAGAGVMLVLDSSSRSQTGLVGALVVTAATLAWAIDNTLTRPLAERDPLQVIAAKGALGAALTATIALVRGEALPSITTLAVLGACGATGYGLPDRSAEDRSRTNRLRCCSGTFQLVDGDGGAQGTAVTVGRCAATAASFSSASLVCFISVSPSTPPSRWDRLRTRSSQHRTWVELGSRGGTSPCATRRSIAHL